MDKNKPMPGTSRRNRRKLESRKTIPAQLQRYYTTLELAEQALENSGESAKKILTEAISTKKLLHIEEGEEVTRTLSVTDITAILDALTFYDSNENK